MLVQNNEELFARVSPQILGMYSEANALLTYERNYATQAHGRGFPRRKGQRYGTVNSN
jgi:hypothetical protein